MNLCVRRVNRIRRTPAEKITAPQRKRYVLLLGYLCALTCLVFAVNNCAQQPAAKTPPGPMLDQGIVTIDTPQFTLKLVRSSQTVAALQPKGPNGSDAGFDFTPGDLLDQRSHGGYYHLGDLDLRLRASGSGPWQSYSTAWARKPVTALAVLLSAAPDCFDPGSTW